MSDKERCGNCRFWQMRYRFFQLSDEGRVMMCKRFPDSVKTESAHWCGEWRAKVLKDSPHPLERDFGTLAKFAINEQWDNVRLLIAKLSRKYRKSHPELADTLNAALRERQDRSWILR